MSNRDYEWLSQWEWYTHRSHKTFYAARNSEKEESPTHKTIFMHVKLFGDRCDHKNRNGLDNRRCNLRKATNQQQAANTSLRSHNTSGFKGVSARRNRWRATIGINGKIVHLGDFVFKEQAAHAYDKAALKYFGEFAVLNFPVRGRV